MSVFHLSKWYLDCVADDGSALIGYWARLRWRSLALEYAAALVAPAGAEPQQFHVLRSPPPPVQAGGLCAWRCEPLRLEGDWVTETAPVQLDLLHSPAGGIRWSIHQPRARARIRFQGAGGSGPGIDEISGLGYVEELELTIPPWRLPFNVLHWGRFLAQGHALVWLQWQGRDSQRRFAVLDGALVEEPEITDHAVRLPGAAVELALSAPRPLREGPLAATVFGAVPGLVGLLPAKFRRAHESKRLSPAELRLPGQAPAGGWSIHEVVTW